MSMPSALDRKRRSLWEDLSSLATSIIPWGVGGDFNIITSPSERDGGAAPHLPSINDFVSCIADCELNDVGFEGVPFTWQWRSVRHRLDRVLFNHKWLETFSANKIIHGVRRCSDHRPLIMAAGKENTTRVAVKS